jgi:hypothetical protein
MWIPAVLIEAGLFTLQPYMDLPFIEWAKVFGLENDMMYV